MYMIVLRNILTSISSHGGDPQTNRTVGARTTETAMAPLSVCSAALNQHLCGLRDSDGFGTCFGKKCLADLFRSTAAASVESSCMHASG